METTRYYYKNLDTQKIQFTRAPFIGWTKPMGLLQAPYAMFQRKWEVLYIPRYLLTKETRVILPEPEAPSEEAS